MRRAGCVLIVVVAGCGLLLHSIAFAQTSGDDTRKKAFQLFNENKHIEALPLLEELALKSPDDREVLAALGICLVTDAGTHGDEETQKKELLRARQLLLKAKSLGQNSTVVENILQTMPEDGVLKFADSPAGQAMKAAEAAFARRDFDEAIRNYSKVLEYEPQNYSAVLFIGDTYFAEKDWTKAGEWYQKAIDLDPNRETAHRYYADMLLKNGDVENSRKRFIQAVVAEPYNPITWRGLQYWAKMNKLELQRVHIDAPSNVSQKDEKNITITIDPKQSDESSAAWLMYGISKASWRGEEFKKHFPQEKGYRHSLPEEAGALELAASAWVNANDSGKKKKASSAPKDPNLALLLRLYQAKMLEPYVLLNAADEGIAQDYEGYREKNREKLEQYLSEWVVPQVGKKE
jgi:tetratricopeptide (TPR) repeat protein